LGEAPEIVRFARVYDINVLRQPRCPVQRGGHTADQDEPDFGPAKRFDERAKIGHGDRDCLAFLPARRNSSAKRASSWSCVKRSSGVNARLRRNSVRSTSRRYRSTTGSGRDAGRRGFAIARRVYAAQYLVKIQALAAPARRDRRFLEELQQ